MSFRLYPRYVKGNPQLRVFLPNFWMKLVKQEPEGPPNSVHFIVPLEMSDADIKNYLEKIYKVPVVEINTHVYMGEIKKTHKNYLIKDDDYKKAFVTLPPDMTFKFPVLFDTEKQSKRHEQEKKMGDQVKGLVTQRERNQDRAGVPGWFQM